MYQSILTLHRKWKSFAVVELDYIIDLKIFWIAVYNCFIVVISGS